VACVGHRSPPGHVIYNDFKPYLDTVQAKVASAERACDIATVEAHKLKDHMLTARTVDGGDDEADAGGVVSTLYGSTDKCKTRVNKNILKVGKKLRKHRKNMT
jgi:hypothetical protein